MNFRKLSLYILVISVVYGCLDADNQRNAKDFSDGDFLKTENIVQDKAIRDIQGLGPREKVDLGWSSEIMYGEQLIANISIPSKADLGLPTDKDASLSISSIYYSHANCVADAKERTRVFMDTADNEITSKRDLEISLMANTRTVKKFIIKNEAECRIFGMHFKYHVSELDDQVKTSMSNYFKNPSNSERRVVVFINPNHREIGTYKAIFSEFQREDSGLQVQYINTSTKGGSELVSQLKISKLPAFYYNYFSTENTLEGNQSVGSLRNLLGL